MPLVLLVIVYLTWRNRGWSTGIQIGAIFLEPVAIIDGWWLVRNVQLYGEVFPITALAGAGGRALQHRLTFGVG